MKRSIRKTINFFAFNILFFAIYLNFIHKDKSVEPELIQKNVLVTNSGFEDDLNSRPVEKKNGEKIKGHNN